MGDNLYLILIGEKVTYAYFIYVELIFFVKFVLFDMTNDIVLFSIYVYIHEYGIKEKSLLIEILDFEEI